jgi:hypothetical protein
LCPGAWVIRAALELGWDPAQPGQFGFDGEAVVPPPELPPGRQWLRDEIR